MITQNRESEVKLHDDNKNKRSQHISAYTKPPQLEFTIDQFEELALARLRVLRWIEKQKGLGKPLRRPSSQDQETPNKKYLKEILIENELEPSKYVSRDRARYNDSISHYIGRMGFCQNDERRRWFIQQELALFDVRYSTATNEDKNFIHSELLGNNKYYETFDKQKIIEFGLSNKSPIPEFIFNQSKPEELRLLPYHKIPFSEVFSLIGKKKIYLLNGFGYVPNNQFITLITGKFRMHLSKGLISAQKALDKMKNDPIAMSQSSRIIHIIHGLHKISSNPSYKSNKIGHGIITANDIKNLVDIHFPLCMQNSYYALKRDGHIKHGTRMSFGLFLKGIGLPYNEAHLFFKKTFFKMGNDKFEKEHKYTFRHLYGLEGKRTNYSSFGCNKIISTQPNSGDHHGCPFKLFDKNNLSKIFLKKNISNNDINQILSYLENNHYQLACRKYFEIQHKKKLKLINKTMDDIESTWSHPNEYFDKSYQLYHPPQKLNDDQQINQNIDQNNQNFNNSQQLSQFSQFTQSQQFSQGSQIQTQSQTQTQTQTLPNEVNVTTTNETQMMVD